MNLRDILRRVREWIRRELGGKPKTATTAMCQVAPVPHDAKQATIRLTTLLMQTAQRQPADHRQRVIAFSASGEPYLRDPEYNEMGADLTISLVNNPLVTVPMEEQEVKGRKVLRCKPEAPRYHSVTGQEIRGAGPDKSDFPLYMLKLRREIEQLPAGKRFKAIRAAEIAYARSVVEPGKRPEIPQRYRNTVPVNQYGHHNAHFASTLPYKILTPGNDANPATVEA